MTEGVAAGRQARSEAKHATLVASVLGGFGLIALAFSVRVAVLARFAFDDFELSGQFRAMGWERLSRLMYHDYSGRVVLVLFGGALTSQGPMLCRWIGPALLVWWWLAISGILHGAAKRLGGSMSPRNALLVGGGVTAGLVLTVADRFQTMRWATGSLVYGIPVALGLSALALGLARPQVRLFRVLFTMLAALCLGLSSGGNETQAFTQPVVCLVVFLAARRRVDDEPGRTRSPGNRVAASVYVAASVIGGGFLIGSPGSRHRAGWLNVSHDPLVLVKASLSGLAVVAAVTITALPGLFALVAIGRFVKTLAQPIGQEQAALIKATQRALTASLGVATFIAVAIPAYSLNKPAPLRAYLPLQILTGAIALVIGWRTHERVGVGAKWKLQPELLRIIPGLTAIVALVGPLMLAQTEMSHLPIAHQNADRFACIDQSLKQQAAAHGNAAAKISAPELVENINFLYADPKIRPNVVTAQYYGLSSITVDKAGPC
jgi:Family of unknown function (DUF6056)